MEVEFLQNPQRVNIDIIQARMWNSYIVGDVVQTFTVKYVGVPFSQSYTDNIYKNKVDEFYISGSSVSQIVAKFTENNENYKSELITFTCGSRAYIKVKVHYK